jgi:NAD(P)-dependent dehydrogenase (short-subunit alcohol dehydrogenase family)
MPIVLITGAKGGLGSTVTEAFLNSGAQVAGVSRSIKQSDFPHPNFTAVAGELSTGAEAAKVADAVAQKYGRIDVLVHLVGGFAAAPLAETDDTTFDRMIDLNLRSLFNITKAVLPHMRRNLGGRIVAIGSRAAIDPGAGVSVYAATKAAVVALMHSVARENTDANITANVLLPGTIDTPANRSADPAANTGKWIRPATLASLILWLTGPDGGQVNAAAIPVFGNDI